MSYFLDMENNQKPEWFELAENDQPVNRPLKSQKSAQVQSHLHFGRHPGYSDGRWICPTQS